MKALVTGGTGFLGRAIAAQLTARGDSVTCLARGRTAQVPLAGVEYLWGDVADTETVVRAAAGCDVVFHVAAKAGIAGTAAEFDRANVQGTESVIEACRRNGIGRLVHTSSPSVVYAGQSIEGGNESLPYPTRFEAHYPRTKAAAEQRVLAANGPVLRTVALRPHLIWGPGDNQLVPRIVARAREGRLRHVGDGRSLVDTVYIDNAAAAHLLAADKLGEGSAVAGKVYFISNGEPVAVGDIIDRIIGAAGLPPVKRSVSPRAAYAIGAVLERVYGAFRPDAEPPMTRFLAHQLSTAHWFDISAARRDLGYAPAVSIDEGVKRLAAWFASEP